MIDFDDVSTYPDDIRKWVIERKNFFLNIVPIHSYEFNYEIINKLQDVWFDVIPEFVEFQNKYHDTEVTGWHITRIEDLDAFRKQGILTINGDVKEGIKRFDYYLNKRLKVNNDVYRIIIEEAKYYWNRDSGRTRNVCFFFTKAKTIDDPQAMIFAANLGGEILNWSLNALGGEAYRKEPYKRLWIWGEPCRVKFKAQLKTMEEETQSHIIRELVFYFAMKDIYGCEYIPDDTGEKRGAVSSDSILQIEKIENYEDIMSQFADFENFYE